MNWLSEETRRLDEAVAKFRREWRRMLVIQLVAVALIMGAAAIAVPYALRSIAE